MVKVCWAHLESNAENSLIAPGAETSLVKAKAEDRKHYYVEDVVYDMKVVSHTEHVIVNTLL